MATSNLQTFQSVYTDALKRNADNIQIYEDRRKKLENLDLKFFLDFVTIPALIPLGNKVLVRGKLVHTNNCTVALSDEYFVKCSVKQAEEIRQKRLQHVNECLQGFEKERDYLLNQTKHMQESVFHTEGKEIIEPFDEDEEKKWREKHKLNLKKHMSLTNKDCIETHESVMAKLDELELQEEINNMNLETSQEIDTKSILHIVNKENAMETIDNIEDKPRDCKILNDFNLDVKNSNLEAVSEIKANLTNSIFSCEIDNLKEGFISKNDNKQTILDKLRKLKSESLKNCKTEEDVLKRLDELEEEEILQDYLDRLSENSSEEYSEDISENEENEIQAQTDNVKKKISFNDAETLTVNFTHSKNSDECNILRLDVDKNDKAELESPSDIYSLFPECFQDTTKPLKSILKVNPINNQTCQLPNLTNNNVEIKEENNLAIPKNTSIVIDDVVEQKYVNRNTEKDVHKEKEITRPISKFKAMRLNSKKSSVL